MTRLLGAVIATELPTPVTVPNDVMDALFSTGAVLIVCSWAEAESAGDGH